MQRGRGAVEADIGDERPGTRLVVEPRKIGALMDIAALLHHAQEIGFWLERVGHGILDKRGASFRQAGRDMQPAAPGGA